MTVAQMSMVNMVYEANYIGKRMNPPIQDQTRFMQPTWNMPYS